MRTLLLLVYSLPLCAGTYWVSPTGAAASWAACQSSSPLAGSAACTVAQANANAVAGDTVYYRGGTYTLTLGFQGVVGPAHNGSSGSMITFAAYSGDTPIFEQTTTMYGVLFNASSYIVVRGLTFHNLGYFGRISNGSHHIEVSGNVFTDDVGVGGTNGLLIGGGSNQNWVTHLWIHGNTFAGVNLNTNGCTDGGGNLLTIGSNLGTFAGNTDDADNFNTLENNVFYHAAHAALDNYGMYQVIRGNVFHNEPWSPGCPTVSQTYPNDTGKCTGVGTPWQFCNGSPGTAYPYMNSAYNGLYSHRNFQITDTYGRAATFILIEGNRAGHAGVNQANDGADNFDLAAPGNIVRYNYFYAAMQNGLMFKYTTADAFTANGGTYNRVFNNTFHNNGIGYLPYYNNGQSCAAGGNVCPDSIANLALYEDGSGEGNVIKNNLMYQGGSDTFYALDAVRRGPRTTLSTQVASMAANFCTTSQAGCAAFGNPKFADPDVTDPTSLTLPDLTLQSSSPAIDGGTNLTQAVGVGAGSTALVVADALYFQDGTWGSDLARGVTFFPDWIAIGTVSNTVQISAIDYSTNTITLASAKTWADGASIWLYKKSDGAVVLVGSAPDYGASEFTPSAVTNGFTGSLRGNAK